MYWTLLDDFFLLYASLSFNIRQSIYHIFVLICVEEQLLYVHNPHAYKPAKFFRPYQLCTDRPSESLWYLKWQMSVKYQRHVDSIPQRTWDWIRENLNSLCRALQAIAWELINSFVYTHHIFTICQSTKSSLKSLHTESENFACIFFSFSYLSSLPIKMHATDAKTQKIEPDPNFLWWTKFSDSVCNGLKFGVV